MEEGIESTGRQSIAFLNQTLEFHKVSYQLEVDGSAIEVSGLAGQTFPLRLVDDASDATLFADGTGWHFHFGDPKSATSVFMFLLTGHFEVSTTCRGNSHWRTLLQDQEKGWKGYQSIVGIPNPFKKPVNQIYKNLVEVDMMGLEI